MDMRAPRTMQLWFTAQEFADAAKAGLFPDLPTDKRNINRRIEAERWGARSRLVRERGGREGGGGFEYHISNLQLWERLSYISSFMAFEPADLEPTSRTLLEGSGELTERARRNRDAKLAVLRMADRFHQMSGQTVVGADGQFVQVFNAGRVGIPDWIRDEIGKISPRTLARWRATERDFGSSGLGHDPSLARKGKGLLETANGGAVETFILGWLAASSQLSARSIRGYVKKEFGKELVDTNGMLVPLPSPRTFQLVIAKLRETKKMALTKVTNPDKYRSNYKLRGTNAYSWVTEPNQLWMIDASPTDALCIDGRWSLYASIDVAPRRLKITLSRTPRASAVCLMLRTAIMSWGVPKRIKTDNGSDFAAEETQRFMRSLEIDPDPSDAYCPDQKPFVERVIGTFQHEVGPQLPGFIGHNVSDRKAIEERKSFADRLGEDDAKTFAVTLTGAELQQKIDDWVEYVYNRRKHGTTDLSPYEAVAASTTPIARVDERALDVLLMPAPDKNGRRKMGPHGIKVAKHKYLSHSILVGTDVFVRLDPHDMGKIYVFDAEDGRFLDIAECAQLRDIDRPTFVKTQKALYEQMVNEDVKRIRKENRRLVQGPSGIDRTIALAKEQAAEADAARANVIALPKREIAHETPAVREALKIGRPAPRRELSAEETAELERMRAEFEAGAPAPQPAVTAQIHTLPESPKARFRRAVDLEQRQAAGLGLAEADARWLGIYRTSAEYLSHQDLYRDFGKDWLTA